MVSTADGVLGAASRTDQRGARIAAQRGGEFGEGPLQAVQMGERGFRDGPVFRDARRARPVRQVEAVSASTAASTRQQAAARRASWDASGSAATEASPRTSRAQVSSRASTCRARALRARSGLSGCTSGARDSRTRPRSASNSAIRGAGSAVGEPESRAAASAVRVCTQRRAAGSTRRSWRAW